MTSSKIHIASAEMTIHLSDGHKMQIPVTSAMLEAFVDACGIAIHDVGHGKQMFYCFNDETIRNNIIPLLPKAE